MSRYGVLVEWNWERRQNHSEENPLPVKVKVSSYRPGQALGVPGD
jgi:hypothetical protein